MSISASLQIQGLRVSFKVIPSPKDLPPPAGRKPLSMEEADRRLAEHIAKNRRVLEAVLPEIAKSGKPLISDK